jgi:hypothetical protein
MHKVSLNVTDEEPRILKKRASINGIAISKVIHEALFPKSVKVINEFILESLKDIRRNVISTHII